MKKILVLGAGRSASTLIQYLLEHAGKENWFVTIGDLDPELARKKLEGSPHGNAVFFDVNDLAVRQKAVKDADLVISLLPVPLHPIVAQDCLDFGKHMLTASYVSAPMQAMHEEAKAKGLIFLNELGLDPGIDHMSAMQKIDEIRDAGGKLLSFKSYCGALIAPEFNNIWGYKFTWAPKNVILAGQATARYLLDGKMRFLPYNRLFLETESVTMPDGSEFEAYANRDSLSYIAPYGLENIPTLLRGTLRVKGYCRAWNAFVKIGLTDDAFRIPDSEKLSWNELLFSFVHRIPGKSDIESLAAFLDEKPGSEVMRKLEWTGILSNEKTNLPHATPAELLQKLLESKWVFEPGDTDMIVMQHQFVYEKEGKRHTCFSSMVAKGRDPIHTAISDTVGLPAAMGAKLILQGKIKEKGVLMPLHKDIYEPIMEELKSYGIHFTESES